jgi:alanyl-tRNA synthetase
MTHVLNYALRKTLGGDVDQKGSLVSDEKFRFDFSFNRAVNSDELSAIEGIVSEVVKAELNVHTDVVALKDALAVQGLRAVFGETYPDPVRVVSVGPRVRALSCLALSCVRIFLSSITHCSELGL